MHLAVTLGERDDLENDTLTLVLLMRDGLNIEWNSAIMKYLKI